MSLASNVSITQAVNFFFFVRIKRSISSTLFFFARNIKAQFEFVKNNWLKVNSRIVHLSLPTLKIFHGEKMGRSVFSSGRVPCGNGGGAYRRFNPHIHMCLKFSHGFEKTNCNCQVLDSVWPIKWLDARALFINILWCQLDNYVKQY